MRFFFSFQVLKRIEEEEGDMAAGIVISKETDAEGEGDKAEAKLVFQANPNDKCERCKEESNLKK